MSEKKTAEIKLRIEPSVKAQWQHLAAEEKIGLSELVVKAVTEYGRITTKPLYSVTYTGSFSPCNCTTCRPIRVADTELSSELDYAFLPRTTELARKFSEGWKPWDDAA